LEYAIQAMIKISHFCLTAKFPKHEVTPSEAACFFIEKLFETIQQSDIRRTSVLW
jgi:hypothetical protein